MKEKSRKQYTIIPKSFKINKKKLRSFMPRNKQKKAPQRDAAEPVQDGGYLLSRECSTIGAGGLNFSVRDGKRWDPAAIAT